MSYRQYLLIGYAIFLLIILILNLLYFFQVSRFRLKGDASFLALMIHILLMIVIFLIGGWAASLV